MALFVIKILAFSSILLGVDLYLAADARASCEHVYRRHVSRCREQFFALANSQVREAASFFCLFFSSSLFIIAKGKPDNHCPVG
jgi:hypothetical protein